MLFTSTVFKEFKDYGNDGRQVYDKERANVFIRKIILPVLVFPNQLERKFVTPNPFIQTTIDQAGWQNITLLLGVT